MISGIVVIGENADKLAGSEGLGSCKPGSKPTPSFSPSVKSLPPSKPSQSTTPTPTPSSSQSLKPSTSTTPTSSPSITDTGPRKYTLYLTILQTLMASSDTIVAPTKFVYDAILDKKSIGKYTTKFTGKKQRNPYWQGHTHELTFTAVIKAFKRQYLLLQPVSPKGYYQYSYSIGGSVNAKYNWILSRSYCSSYCGSGTYFE